MTFAGTLSVPQVRFYVALDSGRNYVGPDSGRFIFQVYCVVKPFRDDDVVLRVDGDLRDIAHPGTLPADDSRVGNVTDRDVVDKVRGAEEPFRLTREQVIQLQS